MANQENIDWSETASSAFDVVDGEFVVVTADSSDVKSFAPLCALLRRMRKVFGMEAAFISEWAGNEAIVRYGRPDEGDATECDTLQSLFGMRLLGAAQNESGRHFDAIPVITADGAIHGTLCGLRVEGDDAQQRAALRSVARLIASWFDEADLTLSGPMQLYSASTMGALSAV